MGVFVESLDNICKSCTIFPFVAFPPQDKKAHETQRECPKRHGKTALTPGHYQAHSQAKRSPWLGEKAVTGNREA